jgi:hypothetical protein
MDLKDTYTRVFLQAADQAADPNTIKQYRSTWWWNVRDKDAGGLRLTEPAIQFVLTDAQIKTYKIDFPKDFAITPQILLWLDENIDGPYYITKKSITVLKEKAAFQLYLFAGDIKKMGYNKALSRKFSQESNDE